MLLLLLLLLSITVAYLMGLWWGLNELTHVKSLEHINAIWISVITIIISPISTPALLLKSSHDVTDDVA